MLSNHIHLIESARGGLVQLRLSLFPLTMTNDDSNQSTGTLPAQPPTPSTPQQTPTDTKPTPPPAATTKPTVPTPAPAQAPPAASNEPLREDMLKNAVSFLSSPNVRSADTAKKVAFLRQKGLTQPEIEEAFKRVGESGAAATTTTATTAAPAPAAVRSQVSKTYGSCDFFIQFGWLDSLLQHQVVPLFLLEYILKLCIILSLHLSQCPCKN